MIAAAAVTAIAAVVGGVVSTMSAVESSKQQADAAEYEGKQREVNAEAERAAAERKNRRIIGERRAINAATGTTTEGSSLAVLLDQIGEAEMEEINISRGAQQFSNMKKYEAKASRGRIGSQVVGGVANTTSSVLGSMAGYGRMGAFKR
jgi:hypothetical protein